ncbi:MAG: hypothetical protein ACYC5H_05530 [Methylovirgula sp.]
MRKMVGLITIMLLIACSSARAGDAFWDEWARYFQRSDTISITAGDAEDVNAVTQIIDPWPRNVLNRHIPTNGERMVGAIDRYQNPRKLGAAAPTLAPIILPSGGSSGGAVSSGSGQ